MHPTSSAFDDLFPTGNITIPPKLTYFLDEVKDGMVGDASLATSKDWMNHTGKNAHYINPVHALMASKHNLSLTLTATYTWRTKLTANNKDRSRLCASNDGRNKISRLKDMLPSVARFILAQGPAEMWAELMAARDADKQSSGQSSNMHHLTRCLRTVLFGTARYLSTVP